MFRTRLVIALLAIVGLTAACSGAPTTPTPKEVNTHAPALADCADSSGFTNPGGHC